MFCSKCGAALSADTSFCGSCGTPVAPRIAVSSVPAVAPVAVVAPYPSAGGAVLTRTPTFAGFWLRFLAYFIDALIMSPLAAIFIFMALAMTGGMAHLITLSQRGGGNELDPAAIGTILFLIFTFAALSILAQWLYHAYLESGEKQATWGKQVLGLYVTDLSGQRITFGRASGRFFSKIVTGMIPLGIGYIMAGFTEKRQALHDMIASTLVLKH